MPSLMLAGWSRFAPRVLGATAIVCALAPVVHGQECRKAATDFTVWTVEVETKAILTSAVPGNILPVILDDSNQTRIALKLRPCANPGGDPGVLASYRVTLILRGGNNGMLHLIGMGNDQPVAITLNPCEPFYRKTLEVYAAASVAVQLAYEIEAGNSTGVRPACEDAVKAMSLFRYADQALKQRGRDEEIELRTRLTDRMRKLDPRLLCPPPDIIAARLSGAAPVMGTP